MNPGVRPHMVNDQPDTPAGPPEASKPISGAPEGSAPQGATPSWVESVDAKLDALGRAVSGLIDATTKTLTGGAPAPEAPAPAAPATKVEAVGQVATEAAAKGKRKVGLLW